MRVLACAVFVVSMSATSVAQECPVGFGFVSVTASSDGFGNVVFDPPDQIALEYVTEFNARIETDNGTGEIEGRTQIMPGSSSIILMGSADDGNETVMADVILNVPMAAKFIISDDSDISVLFVPGGDSPGVITFDDGSSDEGILSAGTYRLRAEMDFLFEPTLDWSMSLSTEFSPIQPPCTVDLAAPCGVLDTDDALGFLDGYALMNKGADLAPPFGTWNFDDVLAFLVAFGSGCP